MPRVLKPSQWTFGVNVWTVGGRTQATWPSFLPTMAKNVPALFRSDMILPHTSQLSVGCSSTLSQVSPLSAFPAYGREKIRTFYWRFFKWRGTGKNTLEWTLRKGKQMTPPTTSHVHTFCILNCKLPSLDACTPIHCLFPWHISPPTVILIC